MGKRIVDIIGGGISGLATAYFLNKLAGNAIHIRLWEKESQAGGLAATFDYQGIEIEKFYHHLFTSDNALLSLIHETGLSGKLLWKPASTGAYYFQRPYRLSKPLDLLRFSPLPFLQRLRFAFMLLKIRSIRHWQSLDDIPAKDMLIRYGGKSVYENVWKPLLEGKFGSHAGDISAAWLWSKINDRGHSRDKAGAEYLGYISGGLKQLFDVIVHRLRKNGHEIHFDSPVQKLLSKPCRKRISHIEVNNRIMASDYVVSAVQTPDLVKVLPKNTEAYQKQLQKIQFISNACLILVLNHSLSKFYWTNVTDTTAPFVGIIEHTNLVGVSDYHQKHLAYISAYMPQDSPLTRLSANELFETYLPYLKKIFPDFDEKIVEKTLLWKARYAQPVVKTGYRRIVPDIQSPVDNLLVCTMAQIYPNDRQISNGVAMAQKTANILCNIIKKTEKCFQS